MTAPEKRRTSLHEFLRSTLPIFTGLPSYERTWLQSDIMAGLAVWAMTVPQALAYAGIAGVLLGHSVSLGVAAVGAQTNMKERS